MSFQDHFSHYAGDYARFRPRYPPELFAHLASLLPMRRQAWDCATGNGQAALGLAPYFERVIATDASAEQIAQATPHPKISYRVALAEQSGLGDGSVQLVTVAQALHWFDFDRFYPEVRRVLSPGGIFAAWGYHLLRCDPVIDRLIDDFYSKTVGPYWPADRKWIEEKYRSIPFPLPEISIPDFKMGSAWNLSDLMGYLGTWSATRKYIEAQGKNPLEPLERQLLSLWGDPDEKKEIVWPLFSRVARIS